MNVPESGEKEDVISFLKRIGMHSLANEIIENRRKHSIVEEHIIRMQLFGEIVAEEKRQGEIDGRMIEVNTAALDRASNFNGVVAAVVYASSIAIVTSDKFHMPSPFRDMALVFLILSLMLFVIVISTDAYLNSMLTKDLAASIRKPVRSQAERLENINSSASRSKDRNIRFAAFMPVIYVASLVFGFFGLACAAYPTLAKAALSAWPFISGKPWQMSPTVLPPIFY